MTLTYDLSFFQTLCPKGSVILSEDVKVLLLQLSKSVGGQTTAMAAQTPYMPREDGGATVHGRGRFHGGGGGETTPFKRHVATAPPLVVEDSPASKVRLLFNKLTDKNFDEYSQRIMRTLTLYGVDEDIANTIFSMASGNNFYVKIYAKLFAQLAEQFDQIRETLNKNVDEFLAKFDHIEYADQADYTRFCKLNEAMDRRISTSLFFGHLAKNGVLDYAVLVKIIVALAGRVARTMSDEAFKNEKDELSEHISMLLDRDVIQYIRSTGAAPVVADDVTLFDFIQTVSTYTIKTHKGMTSKSIFKFRDIHNLIKST